MKVLSQGTITSPLGFLAGAIAADIKGNGKGNLDLGLLLSEAPCRAAGVFTTNRFQAAPVLLCQEHLKKGTARAVVVNSGCANAATGQDGLKDAEAMARLTAGRYRLDWEEVLVASTGVIGTRLLVERIRTGLERIALSREGGHDLARAIMTTDTRPKEIAVSFELQGKEVTIGGIAKGAGMIHPDLATLLCFLATDAAVEPGFLRRALRRAVEVSFNMITVDGDTSPNDSVLLLASGLAGNEPIRGGRQARAFQEALTEVCLFLAQSIARDGEGATRFIEVRVEGAGTVAQARKAARTVASSPLVKAAVYGADPNWGRVIAALGRSGAEVDIEETELFLDSLCLFRKGRPAPFDREEASEFLRKPEVSFRLRLNLGSAQATAWGCDLTPEYVTINSAYTT